jgi:hypothetical protein
LGIHIPGESIADYIDRYFDGTANGQDTRDLIEHTQRDVLSPLK